MPQIIRAEAWDAEVRLNELGLPKDDLLKVISASVAAYTGCTDYDPPTAAGFVTWHMGVRRAREVFCPHGWEADDRGGFSTIVNHERRIKMAVINTDDATGLVGGIPQNRSRKGSTCEDAVASNQLVFPDAVHWPLTSKGGRVIDTSQYVTWHLCLFVLGKRNLVVRAELSAFTELANGYFADFRERILLLGDGEWENLSIEDEPDDLGPEFDIEVRRKK